MSAGDLYARLRTTVMTDLMDWTVDAVPDDAKDVRGFSDLLLAMPRVVTGLSPGDSMLRIAVDALDINTTVSASAMANRIKRIGSPPVKRLVMVYRMAAVGHLLSAGADWTTCAAVTDLADHTSYYHNIRKLEQRRESFTAPGAVFQQAQREPKDWLFRRYVRPIIPPAHATIWTRSLLGT